MRREGNYMDIMRKKGAPEALKTELLAVPVRAGSGRAADLVALDRATGGKLLAEGKARRKDLSNPGTVFVYQTHGELPAEQIALIGVGNPQRGALPPEAWRRFAGHAVDVARRTRSSELALSTVQGQGKPVVIEAVVEGLLLASHPVRSYKSVKMRSGPGHSILLGTAAGRISSEAQHRGRAIAEATCFARDLINEPAAVVTPAALGEAALEMKKELGLEVRVLGKRELTKLKMGAILGVGQGSRNEPRMIEIVYRPTRGSRRGAIALVGKGITFDSGGLSLKPPGNMEIQKRDMAGAAAVLGAMRAVAALKPAIEVRGYVASAENMPGGDAYRPGDVLNTYSGKTVEVLNTDAEGRLVLADALAWAARGAAEEPPRWMVDVATLTGAVTVALGRKVAGVMGTDSTLVRGLIDAGRAAGEPMWELPLVDEYASGLDSLFADLKNIGDGTAGSIFGGLFLREFVADVPWAHIDIAAVAYADKPQPYVPRGAVGWGVRSLVGLVERLAGR